MEDFFKFDPTTIGSKGLVFVGEDVLVYRRDKNTDKFPLHLDLPGGGPENQETPFDNFRREVLEEFNLQIEPSDIVYVRKYPSTLNNGRFSYYPVAKLDASLKDKIKLGNEGLEYLLMPLDEYLARDDAWPIFQERAQDYKTTLEG